MEKTKTNKKVEDNNCKDSFCPIHGNMKLKARGRTFEGYVLKKLPGRVSIQFERLIYVAKYERYEKRRTKLHAKLPECLDKEIDEGDYIQITECRPVSKTIHFVVIKLIRKQK